MTDRLPPLPPSIGTRLRPGHEHVRVYTEDQLRSYAEEAVKHEREACAKAIEAMRDEHCADTRRSPYEGDWCEHDDQCCEFVVAWNDAAKLIRARSEVAPNPDPLSTIG